jgi:phosphate-selective porin
MQFGGYLQYDFLAPLGDEADAPDTFRFRRVRLLAAGDLSDRISWAISAEVTTTPILRDAFVTLRYVPGATIRVGQLVMPYGREQYVFSSNTLAFTERVTSELLASRDAGLVVSNDQPFFGWLSYAAAVANGTRQNNPDNNSAKDGILRVMASPPRMSGLEIGASVMRGAQPDGVRRRSGVDIAYERRLFHVAAEYAREQLGDLAEKRAGYVFGAWRIYPRATYPWFHHVEFGARRTRTRNLVAPGDQWDLSANYYVNSSLRFLSALILRDEESAAVSRTTFHARVNIRF